LLRSGRGLAVVVNRDGMLGCSNQMLFSTDTVTFLKYGVTVKRAAEARWNVSLPGVSIADRISERFRGGFVKNCENPSGWAGVYRGTASALVQSDSAHRRVVCTASSGRRLTFLESGIRQDWC
jgi:hypothetical protein